MNQAGGGGGGQAGASSKVAPFLKKTWEIVSDQSTSEVISWSAQGTSFVVWRPAEFARDILPAHFKHCNFSSFVRQLNTYGFRKVDPDRWEFANDAFRRDNRDLMMSIVRRKPASAGGPAHAAAQPHHATHHTNTQSQQQQQQQGQQGRGTDTTMTDAPGPHAAGGAGQSGSGPVAMQTNRPDGSGASGFSPLSGGSSGNFPVLPMPYPLDLTSGLAGKPGEGLPGGLMFGNSQDAINAMNALWGLPQQPPLGMPQQQLQAPPQMQPQMLPQLPEGMDTQQLPQAGSGPLFESQQLLAQQVQQAAGGSGSAGAGAGGSGNNGTAQIPSVNSAFIRPSPRTTALLDAVAFAQARGEFGSDSRDEKPEPGGSGSGGSGHGTTDLQQQAAEVLSPRATAQQLAGQPAGLPSAQAVAAAAGLPPGLLLEALPPATAAQLQSTYPGIADGQQRLNLLINAYLKPGSHTLAAITAGSKPSGELDTAGSTSRAGLLEASTPNTQDTIGHHHHRPQELAQQQQQRGYAAAAAVAGPHGSDGPRNPPHPSSSGTSSGPAPKATSSSSEGAGGRDAAQEASGSANMDLDEMNKSGKRSRNQLYAPRRMAQQQQAQQQQAQGGHGGRRVESGSQELAHTITSEHSGGSGRAGGSGGSGHVGGGSGSGGGTARHPVRPAAHSVPRLTHDLLAEISGQLGRLAALASEVQGLKEENMQLGLMMHAQQRDQRQRQQQLQDQRQEQQPQRQAQERQVQPEAVQAPDQRQSMDVLRLGQQALASGASGGSGGPAYRTSSGGGAVLPAESQGGGVNMECSAGMPPQMEPLLMAAGARPTLSGTSNTNSSGAVVGGGRSGAGPATGASSGVSGGQQPQQHPLQRQRTQQQLQQQQRGEEEGQSGEGGVAPGQQARTSQGVGSTSTPEQRQVAAGGGIATQAGGSGSGGPPVPGMYADGTWEAAVADQSEQFWALKLRNDDMEQQMATHKAHGVEQKARTVALESQLAAQAATAADAAVFARSLQEALVVQYNNAAVADARNASLEARLRQQEDENQSQRQLSALLHARIAALEAQLSATGLSQAVVGMEAARGSSAATSCTSGHTSSVGLPGALATTPGTAAAAALLAGCPPVPAATAAAVDAGAAVNAMAASQPAAGMAATGLMLSPSMTSVVSGTTPALGPQSSGAAASADVAAAAVKQEASGVQEMMTTD